MKTRVLLRVVPLTVLLAACGSDIPTATDAPERAAFDGGSLGPGHDAAAAGGSYGSGHDAITGDSNAVEMGGSYGPGHDTASDSLTTIARGGSYGPGH